MSNGVNLDKPHLSKRHIKKWDMDTKVGERGLEDWD